MSFFHSGQPCLSISCCHLGPNTFFCISGLLIPIGKTPKLGRSGKKRMTIRKDAMLILCVGRTIVASRRLRRIRRSVSHREALLAENAQGAQSPNRTKKLLSIAPVESHRPCVTSSGTSPLKIRLTNRRDGRLLTRSLFPPAGGRTNGCGLSRLGVNSDQSNSAYPAVSDRNHVASRSQLCLHFFWQGLGHGQAAQSGPILTKGTDEVIRGEALRLDRKSTR